MEITLPHLFRPREYQKNLWNNFPKNKKRAAWIVHRRGGKDKTAFNITIKEAVKRVGTYYYFFPTYAQGKKVLWDGIDKDGMKTLNHIPDQLIENKNDTEMKIKLVNGSIIQIVGTDNFDSIMGTNPIGCVFSEYSLQDPSAWDFIRPILKENDGWALFIYTPRGSNHGKDLKEMAETNEHWYFELLDITKTFDFEGKPIMTKADVEEEIRQGMDPDVAAQEFFCSFSGAKQGAYYSQQMQDMEAQGRVTNGTYDPTLPVTTYWDLGMDDSMSITFFQFLGMELRAIDYFETNGEGLEFYSKYLKDLPYTYEGHYWPHDGEVRELGTGKTRKETAESLGIKPITIVPAPLKKEDGIQAIRTILPRIWMDKTKCKRLIDCLKNYSKEWDEKGKVFRPTPKHDWSSHGNDSFQTFALGYKAKARESEPIQFKYDQYGRPSVV